MFTSIYLFINFCKLGIPVTTLWRFTCDAEWFTPYPVYKNDIFSPILIEISYHLFTSIFTSKEIFSSIVTDIWTIKLPPFWKNNLSSIITGHFKVHLRGARLKKFKYFILNTKKECNCLLRQSHSCKFVLNYFSLVL